MSSPLSPPPVQPRARPTNVDELREALAQTPPPFMAPPGFHLRPNDIMIATFPKCGTTWMQQIVHGLRTSGSMDFEEISLVVPFIDVALIIDFDLDAPQVAEPRAFKTHLPWESTPKGGKYIYVMRNPEDTLLSFYHFMSGSMFEHGSISIDEFAGAMFFEQTPMGRYWDHVRGWWEQRDKEQILYICYEDMKHDLEAAVRRVAAFIGFGGDETRIRVATQQATFDFMRAHETKFDEHPMTAKMALATGMPPVATMSKVRAGRVGDGERAISAETRDRLAKTWAEAIAEPLGIQSYEELRSLVGKR